MNTLDKNNLELVEAVGVDVRLTDTILYLRLNDGREIGVPWSHYRWLAAATPEQRAKWSLEPGGFAIYWEELNDGFEINHLLSPYVIA